MKRNGTRVRCFNVSPSSLIKVGETIAEIVGACVAIIIFNFYPQILGFGIFSNGNWYVGAGTAVSTPLLSQAFFHFVPYLTVIWVLTILLDIGLLRMGQWNHNDPHLLYRLEGHQYRYRGSHAWRAHPAGSHGCLPHPCTRQRRISPLAFNLVGPVRADCPMADDLREHRRNHPGISRLATKEVIPIFAGNR